MTLLKGMSSRFDDASEVEMVVWWMRLADFPRGKNRELIDRLFNGRPPWQEKDVDSNNVRTNLNELSGPRYAADARRSLMRALENSESYFKASLDYGPQHKRAGWSATITKVINRIMKGASRYFETLDSQMALKVLHGIGPVFWVDRDHWCPSSVAIQDVLIPSRTLRSMENLDHFAIYRQFTYEQLYKMTHGPKVDPAWQMDIVNGALKWVKDQQFAFLQSYAQWYAPQTTEEIMKEDMGYMGTDAVATVDVWDFYFHSDEGGREGWRRRIILDTPLPGEIATDRIAMPDKNGYGLDHGHWLYRPSDNRVYADKLSEMLHFQFGDATATAPFRYHSVRSLGWLLYPFCHIQNRLQSKFIDHLFENLNQYFRTSSQEDHERLTKLDLHNWGEIPEGTTFVSQQERWQINQGLVEMAFTRNRSLMDEAAAQYREGRETERATERETATAVMARVNAANALVGSLLATMYKMQKYQYIEIARRFCNKRSIDPDVSKFRAEVLKAGVPEEALNVDCWEITPDRVIGSGNKMLEVAMADKLMAARPLHDPEAQRRILEIYDLANSDDPGLAMMLAGTSQQEQSPSVRKAQDMVGSLLALVQMKPESGENPEEMIVTLMQALVTHVQLATQMPPSPEKLMGLRNLGQMIGQYIDLLGQDKDQRNKAKQYAKELTQLMGGIEKIEQQMAKMQQQAQGNGGQGPDPKDMVKAQAMAQQAQIKQESMLKSHSARTAQRQVQFEMKQRQEQERHQFEMQRDMDRHQMEMAKEAQSAALGNELETAKTASAIRRGGMKSLQE